jgi:hypothetical protein
MDSETSVKASAAGLARQERHRRITGLGIEGNWRRRQGGGGTRGLPARPMVWNRKVLPQTPQWAVVEVWRGRTGRIRKGELGAAGRQTERPTQATTPADKTRMCRRGKVPRDDGVHGKMGKSSRKQDHCKDRLVSFLVNNDKKKQ